MKLYEIEKMYKEALKKEGYFYIQSLAIAREGIKFWGGYEKADTLTDEQMEKIAGRIEDFLENGEDYGYAVEFATEEELESKEE